MSLPWLLQTENGDPRPGLGVVQASPDKMALSLPAQVSKQEFEERTQKARMLLKRQYVIQKWRVSTVPGERSQDSAQRGVQQVEDRGAGLWLRRWRLGGELAGFLAGVHDALDDRPVGEDSDYPEHGRHAVKQGSDNNQHHTFGPFKEADFAGGDKVLGARACVTDHHGPDHGGRNQRDVEEAVDPPIKNQQANQQAQVGVTVQNRIVKSPERSDAVGDAGYSPVGHIEEPGQDDVQSRPAKVTVGKQVGGEKVDGESDEGEDI